MKSNSSTFGRVGEKTVSDYLEKRGYRVIAENYVSNGYEIDIVAFKRGVLAFVEVKTRSNLSFGEPKDAVNFEKMKRIKKASEGLVAEQIKWGKIPVYSRLFHKRILRKVKKYSYDIAEVLFDGNTFKVNYIENAFE